MAKTTGVASLATGRSDIFKVDPKLINIQSNWNGRDFADPTNQEHIDSLAMSIAEIGVLQPLTVYWAEGKIWLTDGECRLRGALKAIENGAEIVAVPVRTEERGSNEADRVLSQLVRNAGKPLSIIEQGAIFKRLLGLGWESKAIAAKAGMTQGRVSQILGLQSMPEAIKTMVTKGEVSASLASQTVNEKGTAAEQALKDALVKANADGKTKIKPGHIEPNEPATPAKPMDWPLLQLPVQTVSTDGRSIAVIVKEAFEFSKVDNSSYSDITVIEMPINHWEAIREALKL